MGFKFCFFIFVVFAAPVSGQADTTCPKRVGYIEKNTLTLLVLPVMQRVYRDLGCETEFLNLPGRRGILAFNEQMIDAEMIRFRVVEDRYLVPFERGKVPLIQLKSYFWKNPALEEDRTIPFGYVKGIIWQENYAKGKPFNAFYNIESMFKAYNEGQIAGFLASGPAIVTAHDKELISPHPVVVELVKESPLYHYVLADYENFIGKFDKYLETNDPFHYLSLNEYKAVNIN